MTLTRPPATGALLAVLLALAAACDDGSVEPPAAPQPTVTVTVTETASPEPRAAPSPTTPGATGGCDRLAEMGDTLAFVVVSSPASGEAVPSPFTVEGCANVFEASFEWELLGADGATLDRGTGTATCGTGCVGTFSFPVSYTVEQEQVGTLRVFTTSARDNSVEHLNAVAVLLTP